jgi:hypothetical protein
LKFIITIVIVFAVAMCRKPYEPPVIKASNHFLAIDGIINTGSNSSSTFLLSRSVNLQDSVTNLPELNAQAMIVSAGGLLYPLTDTAGNGVYVSGVLNLDPAQQYQISVTTSDGNKYLSDLVTPKAAPPIDSLTWEDVENPLTGSDEVNVYVNSHDPTNNTRYYRWDYIETYQHRAYYNSSWFRIDSLIYPVLTPDQSTYNCWITDNSNSILLGTSIALTNDVISHALIATFARNDPKLDVRYSILVRQYPLDLDAYKFWLTVQNNSQSLGGLFDLQPSQITGNIHSTTNPSNTVLGYVTASSIQEMRLFIDNSSLPGWKSNPFVNCPITIIGANADNNFLWSYPDTAYNVYYFNTGNPPTINITFKDCLDCRYQGGTNIQPSFW